MIDLYLITGFLGSGKTTFLKNFIRMLSDKRMHLIINEFGKEGIDGTLLKEAGAVIDEINNGSIFCSCRLDKFEEVLESAVEQSPEVIIVEASGLSNPANVHKILGDGRFGSVNFKGCICIVDAKRFRKVYKTALVCKKQLGVSDAVILNKTDIADDSEIEETKRLISAQRPDIPIYSTSFGKIKKEWLEALKDPGNREEDKSIQVRDITMRDFVVCIRPEFPLEAFKKFLAMFIEDTYRVKGFVSLQGQNYLVDCVSNLLSVEPYSGEVTALNKLVVLSGNGLPAGRSLKKAKKWYEQYIVE